MRNSLKSYSKKLLSFILVAFLFSISLNISAFAEVVPDDFVKVTNGELKLNNNNFYINGVNSYDLAYRSETEITNTLTHLNSIGVNSIRFWMFGDGNQDGFQPQSGIFNEVRFARTDFIIKKAKEFNIKLLPVLVNNWTDYGGKKQYLRWLGLDENQEDAFYENTDVKNLFKNYISHVLTRQNTLTGVKYSDDKTILGWDIINEPRISSGKEQALYDWIGEISSYIKSNDANHLVTVGTDSKLSPDLNDAKPVCGLSSVDFCSIHLYLYEREQLLYNSLEDIYSYLQGYKDYAVAKDKPIFIGELGIRKFDLPFGQDPILIFQYIQKKIREMNYNGNLIWNWSEFSDDTYGFSPDGHNNSHYDLTDLNHILSVNSNTSLPIFTGYTGEYFNNMNFSGTPVLTRLDSKINFLWNDYSPAPVVNKDHFTVRWTLNKEFVSGKYKFVTRTDDGVRLFIDGVKVLDKWIDQGTTEYSVQKDLSEGSHKVVLEYYENYGGAVAVFDYQKIGEIDPNAPPAPDPSYNVKYWNTPGSNSAPLIPSGTPDYTTSENMVDHVWDNGSPSPAINNDHFIGEWTKDIYLEAGNYRFYTNSDDGVKLLIDDYKIIDFWNDHGMTPYTADLMINSGIHNINLQYYENNGGALVQFHYEKIGNYVDSTPVVNGFNAEFFNNRTLLGTPKVTRTDAEIRYVWDNGSPDPAITPDNFSARWTKTQNFSEGTYSFQIQSDDGVRFWIDDTLVIDDWTDHVMKTYQPSVNLTEGDHVLKIEYYERTGGAVMIFKQN